MALEAKTLTVRTNYLVLAVVVLYLVSQLVIRFACGPDWIRRNLYFLLAGIQIFIIMIPAVIFAHRQKLIQDDFFRISCLKVPEGLMIIPMAVVASYVASVLNTLVSYPLERAGFAPGNEIPVPQNETELWIQIIVIAFLPAVCEEFFFRGIIYRAYEGMGIPMAIIVPAVYFALFHFDIRNLLGPLFLGLLIAWYCYRTGSIFAGVLAHFVNNLLMVLTGWFTRGFSREPAIVTADMLRQMLAYGCYTGIVLVILLKAFSGITRRKVQKPIAKRSLSASIMLHWPVCLFYGTYLLIGVLLIAG